MPATAAYLVFTIIAVVYHPASHAIDQFMTQEEQDLVQLIVTTRFTESLCWKRCLSILPECRSGLPQDDESCVNCLGLCLGLSGEKNAARHLPHKRAQRTLFPHNYPF